MTRYTVSAQYGAYTVCDQAKTVRVFTDRKCAEKYAEQLNGHA